MKIRTRKKDKLGETVGQTPPGELFLHSTFRRIYLLLIPLDFLNRTSSNTPTFILNFYS